MGIPYHHLSTARTRNRSGRLLNCQMALFHGIVWPFPVRVKRFSLAVIGAMLLVSFYRAATWRLPHGVLKSLTVHYDHSRLLLEGQGEGVSSTHDVSVPERGISDTSEPGLLIYVQGDLGERLNSLCLGVAYGQVANVAARFLWLDDEDMPFTQFMDLFTATGFDLKTDVAEYASLATMLHLQTPAVSCELPKPPEGRLVALSTSVTVQPLRVHVHRMARNWTGWEHPPGCQLFEKMGQCFASLQPAPAVQVLMEAEDLAYVADTAAILLQDDSPQAMRAARPLLPDVMCTGCAGLPPAHCLLRYLSLEYLRFPALHHTLGGAVAADVMDLTAGFVPSRAPRILDMTARRAATELAESGPYRKPRMRRRLQYPPCHATPSTATSSIQYSGKGRNLLAAAQGAKDTDASSAARASVLTMQQRVAELFVLGEAASLTYSYSSGEAEFVMARQRAARGHSSSRLKEICQLAPLKSVMEQSWSRHIIVDEKIKAVYCYIPKVACTSWKFWLRQVAGLPEIANEKLAHDPMAGRLRELWLAYDESRAIRVLTNPDFFKFVFVRNPFERALSVYLQKHLHGGNTGNERLSWNKMFFGDSPLLAKLADNNTGLLSFPDFVDLVAEAIQRNPLSVEHHIAPQIHLCGLDEVKYDFVGRFEALSQDAAKVMSRLKQPPGNAFELGKGAHPTNSSARLLEMYDMHAFRTVAAAYAEDFSIPFNDVFYDPPAILKELFGNAWRTLHPRDLL